MAGNARIKHWLAQSKIRWAAVTIIWVVLLVTVAIPSWQGVQKRHAEINVLEERLATMDDWAVAGMWLAPSVQERTLPVNSQFSVLFPDRRNREELFLSLARIADQSGVADFGLSEANEFSMGGNDVWSDGAGMGTGSPTDNMGDPPPPTDGAMVDNAMGPSIAIPEVELSTYRVNARFNADYKRIAQFMGGLKKIERTLKVHSLTVRPEKDGIGVDLELDVYVSKAS